MGKQIVRANKAKKVEWPGWVSNELITSELGIKTMRLGRIELNPGEKVQLHMHNCEEIFYILEGTGVVEIDQKEHQVSKGDAVYLEENLKHGFENRSDKPFQYIFIVSQPLRPWQPEETVLL